MVVIAFEAAYNEESGVSDWSLTELGVVLNVVSELALFFYCIFTVCWKGD